LDEQIFPLNEFDHILESNVSTIEKIDEDTYHILKGNFFKILTTQNGSRILQKSLKRTSKDILSRINKEIGSRIADLMTDSYANYFCQKFFGYVDYEDKIEFLVNIIEHFCQISNNKIGTYPLQAVLEQLKTERERNMIIETIKNNNVIEMVYDPQGVHVIEKIVICFEEEKVSFIYDYAIKNFMKLANNTNGLCIIKKIIIHTKNEETVKKIQTKLIENSFSLIQNPFGNYAIQTAVDVWKEEYIMPIIKQFYNKFTNLSMQKFSSNVVEKFLQRGGEVIVAKYVDEVTYSNRIVDLMKNNYGNYVIQKALKLAMNKHKCKLVESILKNLEKIGDKKLIQKWKSIVQSHATDDCKSLLIGYGIDLNNNNNINGHEEEERNERPGNQHNCSGNNPTLFINGLKSSNGKKNSQSSMGNFPQCSQKLHVGKKHHSGNFYC